MLSRKGSKFGKKDFRGSVFGNEVVLKRGDLRKQSSGMFGSKLLRRHFVVSGHYLKYGSDDKTVSDDPKAAFDLNSLDSATRAGKEMTLKLGAETVLLQAACI